MPAESERGSTSCQLDRESLPPSDHDVSHAKMKSRHDFPNRWTYLLANTGFILGYGNWWKFPALCYRYGGVTFLIPYFCCLILLGIPLMAIEIALGRLTRGGSIKGFGALHRRMAPVGISFVIGAFTLMYYPLFTSWTLIYFYNSFKKSLPWLPSDSEVAHCAAFTGVDACNADSSCIWNGTCYVQPEDVAREFFNNALSVKTKFWSGIEDFNGHILLTQTICVIIVFTVILGGMYFIAYATTVSVILSAVVIFILICAGASLPGAGKGLQEYLGKWDSHYLIDPQVWADAAGQCLFSLGLGVGSISAASSHTPAGQNFMVDAYTLTALDTMVSLLAGVSIYSVLGYVSEHYGIPFEDLNIEGSSLLFQTYPLGLGEAFGYPGAQIFSVLFFGMLYLLGCSTIVFIYEGVAMVVKDCNIFHSIRRKHPWLQFWHVYAGFIVVLWIQSFLYCTDLGSWFSDSLDHFATPFGWITIAFFQCVAAGWLPAWEVQKALIGERAAFVHMLTFLWGVTIACIFGFFLPSPANIIVAVIVGFILTVGGLGYAVHIANRYDVAGVEFTYMERLWNVTMYNILLFRTYLNDECCQNTIWRVPRAGMLGLKYAAPVLTNVLFFVYVANPYSMYQYPRDGPDDPEPNFTAQLFVYGQLGPYACFVGLFIMILLPQLVKPFLPQRTVEFYFDDTPHMAKGNAITGLHHKVGSGYDVKQHTEGSTTPPDDMTAGDERWRTRSY